MLKYNIYNNIIYKKLLNTSAYAHGGKESTDKVKIKAKAKEYRLHVKVKVSKDEIVDKRELDRFSRVYLRGFLKPKQIKDNVFEYTGPIGTELYERLQKPITKRDFLFIIEQIVVSIQKLQVNKFPLNSLMMDLKYTYINEITKEVQFLYLPLVSGQREQNMIDYIRSIVYLSKPADPHDNDFVSRFIYFFDAMRPFDINRIEYFIAKEDRSVVNTIRKQNAGQSGFMTNKQQHYYDHYEQQKQAEVPSEQTKSLNIVSDGSADRDAAPTDLLVDDRYQNNNVSPIKEPYCNNDTDATGVLIEDHYYDSDANGLSDNDLYQNNDTDATDLLGEASDEAVNFWSQGAANEATNVYASDEYEPTGLLWQDGGQQDANFFAEQQRDEAPTSVQYPRLVRVLTGETISVNKPVFRLGKEKSYVDYFVANNMAVSRSHADIIVRASRCYVKDLNSKNHTYINGRDIPPHFETEIQNGDRLLLGNEEFIFYKQ